MGRMGPEVSQTSEMDREHTTNTKQAFHYQKRAYENTRKK